VLRAIDDQGREVKAGRHRSLVPGRTGAYPSYGVAAGTTQIDLLLELPAPDTRSLETLSAEVVLATVTDWRELPITNLQQGATHTIDLGALLPGTTLTFTRVLAQPSQFSVSATLTGSAAVRNIEIAGPPAQQDASRFHAFDGQITTKAGRTVRKINITVYGRGDANAAVAQAAGFRLRYPADLREERLQFTLKELDLL
jgi:hypothetical protein